MPYFITQLMQVFHAAVQHMAHIRKACMRIIVNFIDELINRKLSATEFIAH